MNVMKNSWIDNGLSEWFLRSKPGKDIGCEDIAYIGFVFENVNAIDAWSFQGINLNFII